MIDFHCHLDLYPDPDRVLERVIRENMYVLAVTTTPRAWHGEFKLVERAPRVRVALGLHPQLVAERHAEVELLCSLLPEARYVGEVGLDGSPSHRHSMVMQREVLGQILGACAKAGGRILSVHSRGAAGAVLDALEACPDAGIAVLHWFSGTTRELKRAVDLGCWFSIGPAMLATKKGSLLAEQVPKNRVLTETDGPFAKHDGKALVPSDVILAIKALSSSWHVDTWATQRQIIDNCTSILKRKGEDTFADHLDGKSTNDVSHTLQDG